MQPCAHLAIKRTLNHKRQIPRQGLPQNMAEVLILSRCCRPARAARGTTGSRTRGGRGAARSSCSPTSTAGTGRAGGAPRAYKALPWPLWRATGTAPGELLHKE